MNWMDLHPVYHSMESCSIPTDIAKMAFNCLVFAPIAILDSRPLCQGNQPDKILSIL